MSDLTVQAEGSGLADIEKRISNSVAVLDENFGPTERLEIRDLLTITVPSGGATNWRWKEAGRDMESEAIEGLMIHRQVCGALWGSESPKPGTRPVLVTYDRLDARQTNPDVGDLDSDHLKSCEKEKGIYDWQSLRYTQWGSGRNGIGKRAKEQDMLFLLRPDDILPTLIRIPPASIKNSRSFIGQLRIPYRRCLVKLTLECAKGPRGEFSRVCFEQTGVVSEEISSVVQGTYRTRVAELLTAAIASPMEFSGE